VDDLRFRVRSYVILEGLPIALLILYLFARQTDWQQFSTPPWAGYLLTYLLNLKEGEKVLEPSAGTGNLAVWTSGAEINTYTNDIDSRRRILLHQIGFTSTAFKAEFINDFLPP